MLGYEIVGSGPQHVIVTNDWLCDISTWDAARPYLDHERFTYALTDLPGYGRSRELSGPWSVQACAEEVLALADALEWQTFHSVGHSMSCLATTHLAQHHAERVRRVVLLCPPTPFGFGLDDETVQRLRAAVLSGYEGRAALMRRQWGDTYSAGWVEFKLSRWLETASPEAVAGYVTMFAQRGLPDGERRVEAPALLVTGELDAPPLRAEAARELWEPLYPRLEVLSLVQCGHYPMQEMPPFLITQLERFLAG